MFTNLVVALLVASNAASKTLVREQPGTVVTRQSRNVLAYFPFSTPGCYATGAAMGTKGETITVTRATSATYLDASGSLQTCTSGQARVGCDGGEPTKCGLLIEPARTQLYPTPAAPASGTVTFTATGLHQFWVVGSGSQQLSASGTLVASGLPCTATAASPCSFNVTTLGATPTGTLAAVTGALTGAQVEAGSYRTSFIAALGARNADVVSTTSPLAATSPAIWCIDGWYVPESGRAWNGGGRLWQLGTNGSANQAKSFLTTDDVLQVVDGNVASRYANAAGHGFAAGSAHRISYQVLSAMPGILHDGTLPAQTVTGAGSGTWSAAPATLYFGAESATSQEFGGFIHDFRVSKGACK